jgi:molybdopterin molybdotransferase
MLTYAEALEKVLSTVRQLPSEDVALEDLCDRFLSAPVEAAFDLPRFDNSAVDGFGVLLSDVSAATESSAAHLVLTDTIHAGESGSVPVLARGQTVKILTGAPVPPSVEAVIMREFCVEENGAVSVKTQATASENIRRKGDEVKQGQEVLPAGVQVTPPVVGLIASFGHERFSVTKQPRVAVVVTGDELVKPGGSLKDGQIYESNSFALAAAVKAMGLPRCMTIHALDSREATTSAFQQAIEQADVIISAGGVSVGEHDYVKVALEEDLKAQTVFWRIAIKPGKPVYFGFIDQQIDGEARPQRKLIFGLPGNPVSALVTFNLFVKPALRKMQGAAEPAKMPWAGVLESDLKKKPGRMDFVRGILGCSPAGALCVSPTRGQDSHMLSGLAKANCLIQFPADSERIAKGQCIQLELLDWHS